MFYSFEKYNNPTENEYERMLLGGCNYDAQKHYSNTALHL